MGCSSLISSLCQLLLKPICHKGKGLGEKQRRGETKVVVLLRVRQGVGGSPLERVKILVDRQ